MLDKLMDAEQQSRYEYTKAPYSVGKYIEKINIKGKVLLDFGCGWGGEALWLKHQGATKVLGVDLDENSLSQARLFCANECKFTSDIKSIKTASIDYVFSTDVFEHVMDLSKTLHELFRVLKPKGEILSKFGPLFYSPYGCHFYWAGLYPYSHLLFGRNWLNRRINQVRSDRVYYKSWEEMGLNRMTYNQFRKEVIKVFGIKKMKPIPVRGLPFVTKIPFLNKFLIFGCEMHVFKPA